MGPDVRSRLTLLPSPSPRVRSTGPADSFATLRIRQQTLALIGLPRSTKRARRSCPAARRGPRYEPNGHQALPNRLRHPVAHADVRPYGTDYDAALNAYDQAEQDAQDRSDVEVVLLSADSLETIKRTHSSYFNTHRVVRGVSSRWRPPHLNRQFHNAPGKIRTCDLPLRRRALYPLSYGRRRRRIRCTRRRPRAYRRQRSRPARSRSARRARGLDRYRWRRWTCRSSSPAPAARCRARGAGCPRSSCVVAASGSCSTAAKARSASSCARSGWRTWTACSSRTSTPTTGWGCRGC